jgi:SOS-response transcriptional repressor LexA
MGVKPTDGVFNTANRYVGPIHKLAVFRTTGKQQLSNARRRHFGRRGICFYQGNQMLTEVHNAQHELKITLRQDYFYQAGETHAVGYILPMDKSDIYLRIKQRLDEIGMTERQASLAAVGNSQFIRNIRKGTSASPRGENIIKLSKVLKVSESWLLGTTDDQGETHAENNFGVHFGGVVEAGTFRPQNDHSQDDDYRVVPLPHDARYPRSAQYAFHVNGDSMTQAKIFEGMYVLAVDVATWERLHGQPRDGQLVVVARTRNGHPERELTVKRLRIFMDRMELQPCSDNTVHKPVVFPLPLREDADTDAHILAVVLSATWIYA